MPLSLILQLCQCPSCTTAEAPRLLALAGSLSNHLSAWLGRILVRQMQKAQINWRPWTLVLLACTYQISNWLKNEQRIA